MLKIVILITSDSISDIELCRRNKVNCIHFFTFEMLFFIIYIYIYI